MRIFLSLSAYTNYSIILALKGAEFPSLAWGNTHPRASGRSDFAQRCGGRYASKRYRAVLRRTLMWRSMSDADNCYDKAFLELCFGTLKTELQLEYDASIAEAMRELAQYAGQFFRCDRFHEMFVKASFEDL